MNIQIASRTPFISSVVDGPGERVVLFMQGCSIHCPGCQSQHLWSDTAGQSIPVQHVAGTLETLSNIANGNYTIMGGETFDQPAALADLLSRMTGHIIVYTGYTWEQLHSPDHPAFVYLPVILEKIDILVDGPFLRELDDPFISYRGSRNQRPIDVRATLDAGEIITLDWDSPEIILTGAGDLLMPVGLAEELPDIGNEIKTRRCGQSR